jgi:hypothetical protein
MPINLKTLRAAIRKSNACTGAPSVSKMMKTTKPVAGPKPRKGRIGPPKPRKVPTTPRPLR